MKGKRLNKPSQKGNLLRVSLLCLFCKTGTTCGAETMDIVPLEPFNLSGTSTRIYWLSYWGFSWIFCYMFVILNKFNSTINTCENQQDKYFKKCFVFDNSYKPQLIKFLPAKTQLNMKEGIGFKPVLTLIILVLIVIAIHGLVLTIVEPNVACITQTNKTEIPWIKPGALVFLENADFTDVVKNFLVRHSFEEMTSRFKAYVRHPQWMYTVFFCDNFINSNY